MSDETLEARLKRLIVDRLFLQIPPSEIEDDKKLVQDYGVDSASLFELVVGLEEEFGIRIEDREFHLRHFESVSALARFVRAKLDAASPAAPTASS